MNMFLYEHEQCCMNSTYSQGGLHWAILTTPSPPSASISSQDSLTVEWMASLLWSRLLATQAPWLLLQLDLWSVQAGAHGRKDSG